MLWRDRRDHASNLTLAGCPPGKHKSSPACLLSATRARATFTGAHAVAFDGADMYALTGLGGNPTLRDSGGALETVGGDFAQLLSTGPGDAFLPGSTWAIMSATKSRWGMVDTNPFICCASPTAFWWPMPDPMPCFTSPTRGSSAPWLSSRPDDRIPARNRQHDPTGCASTAVVVGPTVRTTSGN